MIFESDAVPRAVNEAGTVASVSDHVSAQCVQVGG